MIFGGWVPGIRVDLTMSGFDTFRRVWSILIFGVYSSVVLIYMVTHVRKRKHIGVVQVRFTLSATCWPGEQYEPFIQAALS
jgi:hypothetical protein